MALFFVWTIVAGICCLCCACATCVRHAEFEIASNIRSHDRYEQPVHAKENMINTDSQVDDGFLGLQWRQATLGAKSDLGLYWRDVGHKKPKEGEELTHAWPAPGPMPPQSTSASLPGSMPTHSVPAEGVSVKFRRVQLPPANEIVCVARTLPAV